MALVLVKLAIWLLCSCMELATFVVFRGLALLVVGAVQLVRLPGQAANAVLEAAEDAIAIAGEFLFGLVREIAVAVASAFLEFIGKVLAGAVELAASAVVEVLEKARAGGEGAAKAVPEVLEAVGKVLGALWENYRDTVGLILENLN